VAVPRRTCVNPRPHEPRPRDAHTPDSKVLTAVHLGDEVCGPAVRRAQVEKAARLPREKYCSVAGTLRRAERLTYEVAVEDAGAGKLSPERPESRIQTRAPGGM